MNRRRKQAFGTYALSVFMLINSVWVTFYPTLVMASSYQIVDGQLVLPDNTEQMKALMNEGNWDGALFIKGFQMPEMKDDDLPPGYDPTTGTYSSSSENFTDSTENHLKNEVYLQQLFPGYSVDDFNNYLDSVNLYETSPNLIQDDLLTLQDMVDTYAGVDCTTVPEEEEDDCKRSKLVSSLDDMRENQGKALFAGANDTIIQNTADLIDGTHPYFDDLYSEECREITTENDDGDAIGLTEMRVCTTTELGLATCQAERFMETEFVESKTILEYAPEGEYELLRTSYGSANIDIQPCADAEDTCLEIRTLESSVFNQAGQGDGDKFRIDGFELKFAEGITVTSGEVISAVSKIRVSDTYRDLSTYADPGTQIFGLASTKILTEAGTFFNSDPACTFHQEFLDPIPGARFGGNFDYPQDCSNPYYDTIPPYISEPNNFQANNENVLLVVKRTVHHFTDPDALPFDEIYTSVNVDNLTKYRVYFERVPVDGGFVDSFVSTSIVDDIDDYPKGSNINVGGEQVPVEINVFDIDLYPANQFLPTNLQVVGDTVESFTIRTIGRPTNQWRYEVDIEFSVPGPFHITADMHRIVEHGIRPIDGEDYCQPVIDTFIESTFPGTASCDYTLGQRVNEQGVVFDVAHQGYLKLMQGWGENGEPPLEDLCWEATLTVDPTTGVGLSEEDKTLSCAGLEGKPYDDCMLGQWCTYDDINGEYVCTDTANGLKESFADACATYLNDPTCTYEPDRSRCEEWHEDASGNRTCLYESHFFACEVDTNGYGIPEYADEVDTICGGPVNCMNGECSNVKKESNSAFAEAAVMSQLATEMKKAKSCAVEATPASCKLFSGEIGKCSQPTMWGASDCCDPDSMGMGGLDVFSALLAMEFLEQATENEIGAGWMTQAWTSTVEYVDGTAVGEWAGSAINAVAEPISGAATTLSQNITSGFTSFMKTIGFDPTVAGSPAAAISDSAASVNAAWNSTINLGINSAGEAITSTFGNGIMQFVAQGVYNFVHSFAPTIANAIFATATAEGGQQVVTGFANEFANEAVAFIAEWFSVVMMIYAIYNLVVGVVYGCKERDYATSQKIKLLSNHYVGTYCAEKLLLGGCVRKVQTHCLYGSPFSRIMAQQIKQQFAEDAGIPIQDYWIDPINTEDKQPDCSGFTIEELDQVNWDRVDLTEFLQITMGMMKYNPNNMPADFTPSEREAGQREGPQAGTTAMDSNIAALTVVAKAGDTNRQTMTAHNMQLVDPDFMPWYEPTEGNGTGCTFGCDGQFVYNGASGMCEFTDRVEVGGTKSCNTVDGYVYEVASDLCVKVDVEPMQTGCPPAFILDELTGKCTAIYYENEPATRICPVGTTWSSAAGTCQDVEIIDTTNDCSVHGEDYVYQDGLCVLNYIADVPPIKECPNSNYTLSGTTCVYSATEPYRVTCPAGEVYDSVNNTCVIVSSNYVPATSSCPDGMNIEGNICIDRQTETPTLLCDVANGWVLNGSQCEKSETISIEPNQACPENYIPSDDHTQCVRYVLAEADPPECPADWTLVAGGYCIRTVSETAPAEYGCSPGFTYDGTDCSREVRYPPANDCDNSEGYYYNGSGECIKTETTTISATKYCPQGTLVGDYCHIPTTESSVLICPADHVLNEDRTLCTKTEITIAPVIVTCPDGYDVSGIQCIRITTAPPNITCPDGATYGEDTGSCHQPIAIIQPPEPYCPEGLTLVAGQCEGREVIQATAICDDPEYTYDPLDKKCFKDSLTYVEPEELCEPGSQEELEGTCASSVTKPPIYECPIGFYYSYDLSTCVSQAAEFVDPLIVCETDWSYDETLKVCVLTDSYVGITCEDGFTYNDVLGQCEALIEISATPYCEDGYAFDGASCIRAIHANYSCPTDFTYSPTLKACEKEESLPLEVECDPGFVLVDSVCIIDSDVPPSCASGFVFNPDSDQCEILSPIPFENSCSAPYYDNGSGCAQLLTNSASCPDGLEYDPVNGRCGGTTPPIENYCAVGIDSGSDCRVKEQKIPTCDEDGFHYDTELQECVQEITSRGEPYCPLSEAYQTELLNERCAYYSVTAKLPNGDCQDGYDENENGYCVKYVLFEDPNYTCPEGFTTVLNEDGSPMPGSPFCVRYDHLPPLCDTANGYAFVDGFCEKYHTTPYSQRCTIDDEYRYGSACTNEDVSSLECPSGYGYSLDNDRCEFIEFIAYSKVCPQTHTLISDQCVSNDTSILQCPDNHTFNPVSDRCEPNILPPICPDGYVYNASLDSCEIREEIPAESSCPPGTFDTGSGCRAFDEARCNDGYILDTVLDLCLKDESILATPVCPDGQYWDNGLGCVPFETPTCPDGATLNPISDLCEFNDSIAATGTCPEGTMWTPNGCIQFVAPSCPALHVYDADRNLCVWLEVVQPGEQCTGDSQDTGSGCRAFEPATCSAGYTLNPVSNLCETVDTIPADQFCPEGYRNTGTGCVHQQSPTCSTPGYVYVPANDRCEMSDTIPATPSCPLGQIDVGSGCQSYSVPTCSAGYTFVPANDRCEMLDTTPAIPSCPLGQIDVGSGCQSYSVPTCSAGYTFVPANDRCEISESIPAIPSCPIGQIDVGSGCQSYSVPTCSAGYTFVPANDRCEKYDSVPASGTCTNGNDNGSGCDVTETVAASCPAGFTPNGNTNCIRTLLEDPACSAGYSYSNANNRCEMLEQSTPSCDAGFSWNSTLKQCIKTQPKGESCPVLDGVVGSYNDGTCSYTYNVVAECPPGWTSGSNTQGGRTCTFSQQATQSCPAGYIPSDIQPDKCSRSQPPNCNAGYTYSIGNNVCEKPNAVLPTCPAGYSYDASQNNCRRVTPATETCTNVDGRSGAIDGNSCVYYMPIFGDAPCPAGWVIDSEEPGFKLCTTDRSIVYVCASGILNGQNCIQTTSYSCPNGYSWSADMCHGVLTHVPSCSAGYNYHAGSDACIQEVDYNFSCPLKDGVSGSLSGSTCNYSQVVSSDNCAPGWTSTTISGGKKCDRTQAPTIEPCPAGWAEYPADTSQCYQTSTISCSLGSYNGATGKCERTLTAAPTCSAGYTFVLGLDKCRKYDVASYICPATYGYNSATGLCERINSGGYDGYDCPTAVPAFSLNGATCERTLTSSPICPAGQSYQPSHNQCRSSTVDYDYDCPTAVPAFSLNGATCERTLTSSPICPAGQSYQPSHNQCRSSTGDYDYDCPTAVPAFSLNGTTCERTLTSSPICPVGQSYQPSHNQCRSSTGGYDYDCPTAEPPWSVNGSTCERIVFEPVACQSGYSYNSALNKCEQNVEDPYSFECPTAVPAYSNNGSTCSRILTELPNCSAGYSYNDVRDRCEKNVVDPYDLFCSPDFEFDPNTDMCNQEHVAAPYCDAGWTYIGSRDRCERDIVDPFIYECPDVVPPYSVNGDRCERVIETSPSCEIPYQYISSRDRCEAPQEDYGYQCPDSWTVVGDRCERQLQHDPICDAGFTYNNNNDRCEADIQSDYDYHCTVGWILDGNICYRYIFEDPSCTADYIFENDVCRPYEERPPVEVCLDGWIEDGGSCVRTVEQSVSCSAGYRFSPQANQCTKIETAIVGFQCPDGYTLAGDTCQYTAVNGDVLTCDTGYSFDVVSSQCTRTQYAYPIYICPVGYDRMDDERTCRKIVDATAEPIGMSCPYAGFELEDGVCLLVYNVDMSHYCSDPSYELVPTPLDLDPPIEAPFACEKIVRDYMEPSRSCPLDYEVYATDYCTQYYFEPPEFRCPVDLTPSTDGSVCEGEGSIIVPPVYSCPSGYVSSGALCMDTEYAVATLACESGSAVIIDGTCRQSLIVNTTPPTETCSGEPLLTWILVAGSLPMGLTLHVDGTISGTPTEFGVFNFDVKVVDPEGAEDIRSLSLNVEPPPTITTTSLPPAIVDEVYSHSLIVEYGTGPYEWSIVDGQLPNGLTMSNAGVISGTPTTIQTTGFDVQVIDSNGVRDTASLVLSVEAASLADYINFNDYPPSAYGGTQDGDGTLDISSDGYSLSLFGNRWQSIEYPYEVTANTVIEFTFSSSSMGEVQGVGFDTNNTVSSGATFNVYGSQVWGIRDFAYSGGGSDQTFVIPVGEYYQGSMTKLYFANDHDVTFPTSQSTFSNVHIYESLPIFEPLPLESNGTGSPMSSMFDGNGETESLDTEIITISLPDGAVGVDYLYTLTAETDIDGCPAIEIKIPEYSCPDGTWTLHPMIGVCQKTTQLYLFANYSCPEDMVLDGNFCVLTQKHDSAKQCPTSAWTLVESTCTRSYTETKPADICKPGDIFRFNACFTPEYHAFVEGCGVGQSFNVGTGMCEYSAIVYDSPVVLCSSPGFNPVGLTCQKVTTANIIYGCSSPNFTLVGAQCYEEVVSGGNPQFGCPSDFTDTGTECTFNDSQPVDITCPDRFYYDPDADICQTDEIDRKPSTAICPDGYDKLDQFKCRRVLSSVPPVYECLEPSLLDGNTCRVRSELSIEQGYCLPPFEQIGEQCERRQTELWELSCPDGTDKLANACYQTTVTSAIPTQTCDT